MYVHVQNGKHEESIHTSLLLRTCTATAFSHDFMPITIVRPPYVGWRSSILLMNSFAIQSLISQIAKWRLSKVY